MRVFSLLFAMVYATCTDFINDPHFNSGSWTDEPPGTITSNPRPPVVAPPGGFVVYVVSSLTASTATVSIPVNIPNGVEEVTVVVNTWTSDYRLYSIELAIDNAQFIVYDLSECEENYTDVNHTFTVSTSPVTLTVRVMSVSTMQNAWLAIDHIKVIGCVPKISVWQPILIGLVILIAGIGCALLAPKHIAEHCAQKEEPDNYQQVVATTDIETVSSSTSNSEPVFL